MARMDFVPYDYQKKAIEHIMNVERCGLFLDMGLGKTVCALTAINNLINSPDVELGKVLVIAPLRVARTVWKQEAEKWNHLSELRFSLVLGTERERSKALCQEANIYVINRENVPWLLSKHLFRYDMVVIDELSSFKHPNTLRFRKLKNFMHLARRVVGLTGTPMPNGYLDLWSEIFLLDEGDRLFTSFTRYKEHFFRPAWGNGCVVYKYELLPGRDKVIQQLIGDICISMKKEDYLDMPGLVFNNVEVELSKKEMEAYRNMEVLSIMPLMNGTAITAMSAAAASMKLQQIANGAVYDDSKRVVHVHDAKLDALEDLIEQANGQPVLVFTNFKHDIDRIKARLGDQFTELKTDADIAAWNAGKLPVAGAHPASIGHGLNLQYGGHIIVWFGLTWSLELYEQANNRLYRQGQKDAVSVYHIVAKGTVDEACLESLSAKSDGQKALMEYLSARGRELSGKKRRSK